jgi:Clp amino terminal domain, pathogenicity island component
MPLARRCARSPRRLGLSHQRVHQIIDSGGAVEQRGRPRRRRLLKRLRQTDRCGPSDGPFERFLADVRDAIVLAQEEARALNHNYVGTEHILLGLLSAEGGLAARLLAVIGVEANAVRSALEERLVGRGATEPPPGPLSFTPRSKKALELALREAKEDRSVHVRSEHLLLGIARVREGLAARVLRDLGADYDDLQSRLRARPSRVRSAAAPGLMWLTLSPVRASSSATTASTGGCRSRHTAATSARLVRDSVLSPCREGALAAASAGRESPTSSGLWYPER